MRLPTPVSDRMGHDWVLIVAGALMSLGGALALFTRYSIDQFMSRDESIYTYAAEQFARGRPPYVSIFDPKGPGASILGGLGDLLARLFGANEIHGIRVVFFLCSCLTVVAVYLLAQRLFRSVTAGLVAASVFASFIVFARDALGGPDAKTPGILAAVLSMWLLARRQWLLAGVAAGIAFLVWQPLLIYFVLAVLVPPMVAEPGRKLRQSLVAAAGVLIPWMVVGIYLALAGALGKTYESAILFPLTGIHKAPFSLHRSLSVIKSVIVSSYGPADSWLLALGIGALFAVGLVRVVHGRRGLGEAFSDPLICVVLPTGLFEFAYALYDFQGGADTIPFTPYAALGAAAVAAALVSATANRLGRRAAVAAIATFSVAVAAHAWVQFGDDAQNNKLLRVQVADGCALERITGAGQQFYAMGDPTPFAVTERRSPDRYIYLGHDVDKWKIEHTHGGFAGWTAQIAKIAPPVVVIQKWDTQLSHRMRLWIRRSGYTEEWLSGLHVYVASTAKARAVQAGITLTPRPTLGVLAATDGRSVAGGCG